MGFNGSGTFSRLYSWVADKAAGLNISSTRMDADSNDMASSGFGNCLTRDGQGQPTANLPMDGFRHTGVQNAVNRTDYAAMQQAQDGLIGWTIAGGTADAITASYTPSRGAPSDGALYSFRATAANATTTPTFAPDGQTAEVITKVGGSALVAADIPGNLAEMFLRYNSANTRYELLNPSLQSIINASPTTGDVKLTLKSTADSGWLLFDDGTFGDASSGSSNSNSAANEALFTLLYNSPFTDTTNPILTSSGSATTRSAQGTAAQAWAAHCRMTLPKTLGRALAVAGSGSGLTDRALGSTVGAETATIAQDQLPNVAPTFTGTSSSGSTVNSSVVVNAVSTGPVVAGAGVNALFGTITSGPEGIAVTPSGAVSSINGNVTQQPLSIMQPSSFLNIMVKQ